MRTIQAMIIVVASLALGISTILADTYYFQPTGDTGDWSTSSNWKSGNSCSDITGPGATPDSDDDAVICATKIAEVTGTTAVARNVTIEGVTGTRIDIKPTSGSSATLTLGSGSSPLTSNAAGEGINLLDATGSSNKATLAFVSANHTLAGGGILGSDDLAEITIASGKTLFLGNDSHIQGNLKIVGAGKFVSVGGDVVAGPSGGTTLLVAPYEVDDDMFEDTRPRWRAYSGSTLQFSSAISVMNSLVGNFAIGGGTDMIIVDKAITTTGKLSLLDSNGTLVVNQNLTMGSSGNGAEITAGTIEVAANKTFIHY